MHILASQVRDQMNAPPVSDPSAAPSEDEGETREAFLRALRDIGHGVPHAQDNIQAVFDAADVPALSPHQVLSTPTVERPELSPQRDESVETSAHDSHEEADTTGEEQDRIDMHSLQHDDEISEKAPDAVRETEPCDVAEAHDAMRAEPDEDPVPPASSTTSAHEAQSVSPGSDSENPQAVELSSLPTQMTAPTSERAAVTSKHSSADREIAATSAEVPNESSRTPGVTAPQSSSEAPASGEALSELETEGEELQRALQQVADVLEPPTPRTATPVAPVAQEASPVHELLLARMLGQLDPGLQRAEERVTLPERPLLSVGGSKSAEAGASTPSAQVLEQPRMREQQARSGRALSTAQRARTMEKVEEVLKEVARSKDGKTISFRLDPPSLGSMRAEVSMRDGVLHARLWAESSQVTSLLREKSHELHSALRKLGLPVDQVAVSVSSPESEFSTSGGFSSSEGSSHGGRQDRRSEKNSLVDTSGFGILNGATPATGVDDHWVA